MNLQNSQYRLTLQDLYFIQNPPLYLYKSGNQVNGNLVTFEYPYPNLNFIRFSFKLANKGNMTLASSVKLDPVNRRILDSYTNTAAFTTLTF